MFFTDVDVEVITKPIPRMSKWDCNNISFQYYISFFFPSYEQSNKTPLIQYNYTNYYFEICETVLCVGNCSIHIYGRFQYKMQKHIYKVLYF